MVMIRDNSLEASLIASNRPQTVSFFGRRNYIFIDSKRVWLILSPI